MNPEAQTMIHAPGTSVNHDDDTDTDARCKADGYGSTTCDDERDAASFS